MDKPVVSTGREPEGTGGWALRAVVLTGAALARTRPMIGRLGRWAAGRQISPGTLNAVSLLLALCAAIWLSGGSRDRVPGLLALAASVLASSGAGWLAAFATNAVGQRGSAGRGEADADDAMDWLALPDVQWAREKPAEAVAATGRSAARRRLPADEEDDVLVIVSRESGVSERQTDGSERAAPAVPPGRAESGADATGQTQFGRWPLADAGVPAGGAAAGAVAASGTAKGVTKGRAAGGLAEVAEADPAQPEETGAAAGGRDYRWAAAVSAVAAESAIYGGLAAGGVAGGPAGMWPLAVLTIVSAGVADLLGACRGAGPGAARIGQAGYEHSPVSRARRLPALPSAARIVLAGLAFALAGPQAALFAVLGADVVAMLGLVVTLGRIAPASRATSAAGLARARRRRPARTRRVGMAVLGQVSASDPAAPAASGTGTRTRVTAVVGVPGPTGTTAVRIITSAAATRTARDQAGEQESDEVQPAGSNSRAGAGIPGASSAPSSWLGASEPGASGHGPSEAGASGEGSSAAGAWAPESGLAEEADSGSEVGEPIPVGGVAGTAARPGPAWAAGSAGARGNPAMPGESAFAAADQDDRHRPDLQAGGGSGTMAGVLALRDDGAAALWAGRLVQGNLIPLPPALAGLIATAMLAALGLGDLRGFIAMTPPIVMMLAAPGSSHPHDGRFDWLVPALLALAQYVYLGALGFAVGVRGPIIFAACALTALWYAGLAAGGTAATGGGRARTIATGAGWEVRLLVTGLAVTFGLGTVGYVGLAAYLGVLLCRQAATRHLTRTEDDRQ